MSDPARYYLEQSVPELEDLQKKNLFEKHEITMIIRRRTDFEQRIAGGGTTARDFLKYADFEINMERLRRKRYKRLSSVGMVPRKPSVSDWAGQRRVFFILERGTRKFPKDLELWSKYLNYAKEVTAIKIIYKVYSRLLQLQPRNIDAWLSAAKYEFEENSNAKGTRNLFQKALKLNPESLKLWLSYAQFELAYVAKLLARRQVLGLVTEKEQQQELDTEEQVLQKAIQKSDKFSESDDMNDDMIVLPDDEVKDQLNHLPEADMNVLGNPETNPVLRGDVALTVFDLCIPAILKNVSDSATITTKDDKVFEIVHAFLQVFDSFESLNRDHLYNHVLQYLQINYEQDVRTKVVDITLPIRTIAVTDESLADNLQLAVNKFIAYKVKIRDEESKSNITAEFTNYLTDKFLTPSVEQNVNEKIIILLRAIIKKCRST